VILRLAPAALGRAIRRTLVATVAVVAAGCRGDSTRPIGPAVDISAEGPVSFTGVAGATLPTPITVIVTDAEGRGVSGVTVTFAVTSGLGTTSPRIATTNGEGRASTTWTLSTTAGFNQVTVSSDVLEESVLFMATGTAGPAVALQVSPKKVRIPFGVTTGTVAAQVVDQFGNATTAGVTLVSRDPTLFTVNSSGAIQVVSRGRSAYVVATSGSFADSALVIVLSQTDPVCTGFDAVTPAIGAVVRAEIVDQAICVRGGGEYALVAFHDSPAPSVFLGIEGIGYGVTSPGTLGIAPQSLFTTAGQAVTSRRGDDHHDRLRDQEAALMPAYAAAARAWFKAEQSRAARSGDRASASSAIPSNLGIGDVISLNVESDSFCTRPVMRDGRVAAITQRAIIVADVGNPTGGFTDAEYAAIGSTFDTQIYPTLVTNFGEPSDIDDNDRVVLFYTKAVNDLSPPGAGNLTLGFYYSRDLLPKSGPLGSCPGSNVGEMFYLMVPNPTGSGGGAVHTKADVQRWTSGTAAHEFQHLINASRRLYVHPTLSTTEERWLNEGLSHIGEELMFYAVTGLSPRQNLGASAVEFGSPRYEARRTYLEENFDRLSSYLQALRTEVQAPIGRDDDDDDLPTRGAAWAFLRYAADRLAPTNERDFWFNLVNSNTTGVANLNAVFATDARQVIRDWTMASLLDDLIPTASIFQQPSWNFRQVWQPMTGFPYPLGQPQNTRTLQHGTPRPVTLFANGVSYLRFAIAAGGEAYVAVTAGGVPAPAAIQLSLVRTK
jgi:hypothetical protein